MVKKIVIFIWNLVFLTINCTDRFAKEELGLPDRPRFTCGHLHYYNCTIINGALYSNFKIGMFQYGKKVQVEYSINDTYNYNLQSFQIENFHFAVVKIKQDSSQPNVLLTARDANSNEFIDKAVLRIDVAEKINSAPNFLNNSITVVDVYDDNFVGSQVGHLVVENTQHPVFTIYKDSDSSLDDEFGLTVDGRIILTKKLNAKLKNFVQFNVHVFSFAYSLTNFVTVKINILPGKTQTNIGTTYLRNQYIQAYLQDSLQKEKKLKIPTSFKFSFSELAPKSTIIGCLHSDTYGELTYEIIDKKLKKIFSIGQYTGVLSILDAASIDYEQTKSYQLSIAVEDRTGLKKSFVDVTLNVEDANDNPPVFTQSKYSVNISESTAISTTIFQVKATSADQINNNTIYFTLTNQLPVPFSVNYDGTIKVTESLDLLTKNNVYYLYIKALDSGNLMRLETMAVIQINIMPVNSHRPIMMQSKCQVFFTFQSKPSDLITFEAVDQDIEDSFTFHLENKHELFELDQVSGVLKLTQNIRMENTKDTVLYVKASDGVHFSNPCEIKVKFQSSSQRLVRCNENVFYTEILPKIKAKQRQINPTERPKTSPLPPFGNLIFTSRPKITLHISEDAPIRTQLFQYSAIDSNRACYGVVLYTIVDGNSAGKFQIDTFNGTLFLMNPLLSSKTKVYSLTIKALDVRGHSVVTTTRIEVQDVNNNHPVFSNNGFYKVNYTASTNKTVIAVSATDIDEGRNGQVFYTLVNPTKLFTIDHKSGQLRYVQSLDELPYSEFFVEIQATDNGLEKQLHSFAVVHIKKSGAVNLPPLCLTDKQKIEVPVNTPVGTIVGRVFGYDRDTINHPTLTYSVIDNSGMKFSSYFSLMSDNGLIMLKRTLSQKDKGFIFNIAVQVTDGSLFSKCHVYKIIVDAHSINQITFLQKTYPNQVEISNMAVKKSFVMAVQAVITDKGATSAIHYDFVDGDGINMFYVDQPSGSIYIKNTNFKKSFYWLTVQAYLAENPTVYVNTHVIVKIKDSQIRQSFLNPSVYQVHLLANTATQRFITQLFSTNGQDRYNDDDSHYSIYAGNSYNIFKVVNDKVYSQKKLDIGTYRLNITVSSASNSSLISHGYIVIDVTDTTSKPPSFPNQGSGGVISVDVYESKGELKPPFLFQAFASNNGNEKEELSYSIDDPFKIDRRTAAVTADALEAGETHYVEVKVTNSANQEATIYFVVNVIERPKEKVELNFKKALYSFKIKENVNGETLMDLSQEIKESDLMDEIFFYIIQGNDDANFYILPGQSSLIIRRSLDFERKPMHSLQILGFNGQSFAQTQIEIEVLNLNDNPLTVSQSCYEARIPENTRSSDNLITVQATDPDRIESDYNYIMINNVLGQSPFVLSQTGDISIKHGHVFDREFQHEHVVTVVVGSQKDNTTYCVKVKIDDMNDHTPNFTRPVYERLVYDSAVVGNEVMAVYATDEDEGSNAELNYKLVEPNDYFEMDKSGVLKVKKDLYGLETKSVSLRAEVSDGGQPAFSSFCEIKITILNDLQKFKFNEDYYYFEVEENLPAGSLVSQFLRINISSMSYEIIPDGNRGCYNDFWIDSISAVLLTKEKGTSQDVDVKNQTAFDYEVTKNCSFIVTASLYNKLIASTHVYVGIVDLNDNQPIFPQDFYNGSILEGKMSNSKISTGNGEWLTVAATDLDGGLNGELEYSILENDIKVYFSIAKSTGEILSNMVLDYEKHPTNFKFHVKAIDKGDPSYSAIVPVTIQLENINDRIPEFYEMDLVSVLLPVYEGCFIYHMKAFDTDNLPGQTLKFMMSDSNNVFDVGNSSGIIYVKNPSNLDITQDYMSVKVSVSDGKFERETSLQLRFIQYVPSNTFRFVYNNTVSRITENIKTPQVVAVINPIGYASGEALSFRILNPTSKFHIDSISGVIKTNQDATFDRENKSFYNIYAEVKKTEQPSVVARIFINVTVDDLNDNVPVFTRTEYYQAMNIDSPINVPVLTVHADDADLGENGRVRYKLLNNKENFHCDEFTGTIYLRRTLKRSQALPKYTLRIQAYDNGTNVLSSETKVQIPIINKDQPVFSENYQLSVREDAWIGNDVGVIKAKGRNERLVYYNISSGDPFQEFDIGFSTGALVVSSSLNASRQSVYRLSIRAIDSLTGSWSETECVVNIIDVNNNVPLFKLSSYKVELSESTKIGSFVIALKAYDDDFGINAQLVYSLTESESSSYFSIDGRTGVIKLASELDAEVSQQHLLYVTVSDQGEPQQKSFTTVLVHVIDINDNWPYFLDEKYVFYVDSYDGSGKQFIGKVHAFDRDTTDQLTYSIVNRQDKVSIDKKTGVISLLSNVEALSKIELEVKVTDGTYSTTKNVNIEFNAKNENSPTSLKKLDASIVEGTSSVLEVARLDVIDKDKGKYGELTYQIDSQCCGDVDYFSIDNNGTIFTTGQLFDREVRSEYIILVRATDSGGLFTITTVTVAITDLNDHAPVFEFSKYLGNIKTSQVSSDSLLHVMAVDYDAGANAALKYTSEINDQNTPIKLNDTTGLVSLAGTPVGAMYQFFIRATDNGFPVRTSNPAHVQIAVKGWSDALLKFKNDTYQLSVPEDIAVGTVITTVEMLESNYNGSIRFKLVDGNLPHTKTSKFFKVNSRNGKVKIIHKLDYESIRTHKLMIRAVNKNSESMAMCFVYIEVQNLNDNSPKFVSKKYEVKVAENVEIGTRILKVSAIDLDDATGKMLRFSLQPDTQEFFSIHARTGWVKVNNLLDHEKQSIHELSVTVKDDGGKTDQVSLIVHLVDINDSPPRFLQSEYTFYINQDVLMGQNIGVVKATDSDIDSVITYYIETAKDADNIFAVNSRTGDVRILREPKEEEYSFTVIAYDQIHTSQTTVKVLRNNINTYYPYCLHSYYKFSVPEDTKPLTELTKIQATDMDVGDQLKFSVQGDGIGKFSVHEKSGSLRTVEKLDRDIWDQYNFKVVVTDKASHSCESDIFITVTDSNNKKPMFEQKLYIATVRENATESVIITRVNAIDTDLLANKVLSYKLIRNQNNMFSIDNRGIITLSKPHLINPNVVSNYSLLVQATDDGRPQLSSTTKLQMIVLSVLDTPPKFDKFAYTFTVNENRPQGTHIGDINVTATTSSLREKAVLMRISNDPNRIFSLTKDGRLKVEKPLDYEKKKTYRFNVKAWFERIPSLSSMASVEVKVLDLNDHTPKFLQRSYFKLIDENVRPGTFVVQAYATDSDGTLVNSQVKYNLIHTTPLPFTINPLTGEISVNGTIDHETQSSYNFYVSAEDTGEPRLSTNVPITVNVSDLNDNSPIISEYNKSMIVQEGKTPGSTLLKLFVRDIDSPKNGAPFRCELYFGSTKKFVVNTENGNTCVLKSKEFFRVEESTQYELTIRVTDSGSPRRYSESKIRIIIVKESYQPPTIQEPKLFFVIVSRPYGITKVGQVNVYDEDINDIHQFSIVGGNRDNYFRIQPLTGLIEGRPMKGRYTLSIEVSDGKNTDSSQFQVVVNEIDNDVKRSSVPMYITNITPKDFLQNKLHRFVDRVANILGREPADIFIWSLQDVTEEMRGQQQRKRRDAGVGVTIRLAFAVWDPLVQSYMSTSDLKTYIMDSKDVLSEIGLDVTIPNIKCSSSKQCTKDLYCALTLTPKEEISSAHIPSGYMTFIKEEKCYCEDGSEGPFCYSSSECASKPCKRGEKCIPTPSSYRCVCHDERYCYKPESGNDVITLDGRSYVSYVLRRDFDALFSEMSFEFRTDSVTSILFYAHGKDFFIVEVKMVMELYVAFHREKVLFKDVDVKIQIEKGILKVRFNFGSGVGLLSIDDTVVNDGKWHYVHITRSQNFVVAALDYNAYRRDTRAPGDSSNINLNGNAIVFGAGVSKDGSPFSGFKGCIKSIKLNKNLLPYSGSDDFVLEVTRRKIQYGCKDSNMCSTKQCPAFSDCFNTFVDYQCVCLSGHFGPSCTTQMTCANSPCKNGGTCTYEQVNGKVRYKCTCPRRFTGDQCHIDLKACRQQPCLNNGRCTSTSEDEYHCECPTGVSGKNCEFMADPCSSNPCYYNARCVNLVNDYKCECEDVGKRGKQCIAGEHCQHTKCRYGGECSEGPDNAMCMCNQGYQGVHCQGDVNECLSTPCGTGTCVNNIGSYYCNCTDGGIGLKCAQPVTSSQGGLPLLLIVAGAGGALLVIIIVVICICCCRKRRRKQAQLRNPETSTAERKMYPLDRYPGDDNQYELAELFPPSPPPRGFPAPPSYYDENDQASAAMYDPSMVTFSNASSPAEMKMKLPADMLDMVDYQSDDGDLRYHWDYSEVPEDVMIKKMSREGSRIGLTKTDQYYPEDGFDYVDIPQVPERPASRRSSLPGYADSETDIPELPELPHQVRTSRQSLRSGQSPPSTLPRLPPHLSSAEFQNRYSLLSDEQDTSDYQQQDTSYFHDILEGETVSDTVPRTYTKPYGLGRYDDSDIDNVDGCTETSFNSDDDDDADENDPLDPENTRQLERDIKKLIKDLQERTDED